MKKLTETTVSNNITNNQQTKIPKRVSELWQCENCHSRMDETPVMNELISLLEEFMEKHPSILYELCGRTCNLFHIAIWDDEQICKKRGKV